MGFFNFSGGKATTTFKGKAQDAAWDISSGIISVRLETKDTVHLMSFSQDLGMRFWTESAGKKNLVVEVKVASDKPDVIIEYTILSHS